MLDKRGSRDQVEKSKRAFREIDDYKTGIEITSQRTGVHQEKLTETLEYTLVGMAIHDPLIAISLNPLMNETFLRYESSHVVPAKAMTEQKPTGRGFEFDESWKVF